MCTHVCVSVCWENPDRFVLFVNFSAGEKRGRRLEARGRKNEQEVSFSLMDEEPGC